MKVERIGKFNIIGDDFKGEYEENGMLERNSVHVRLRDEISDGPLAGMPQHPNACFYSVRNDDDIDRLAAAAKMILRAIPKKEN